MAVLVIRIADFHILRWSSAYSTVLSALCKGAYLILKQAFEMGLVITSTLQMKKQKKE